METFCICIRIIKLRKTDYYKVNPGDFFLFTSFPMTSLVYIFLQYLITTEENWYETRVTASENPVKHDPTYRANF